MGPRTGKAAPAAPRAARPRSWQHAGKRGLDILLASTMLLVLMPVMLVITLLVLRDGKGAFFSHRRVGRDGQSFGCLKFRSMVPDAEAALAKLLAEDAEAAELWRNTRKLKRDPRITRIGRVLRATSLDELPQLFNVLRGDMSLVGPRPVVQAELTEHYGTHASHYLAVRPGITGLWQISGRSDTSYAQRIELDVHYVERFSLWFDLVILAKTVPAVLVRRGAC
ncbi:sugar transferase [Roseomonas sp. 18066]|uniref:sugar transferase n=1 Tax=Roseomonas sp. 18066 TaxID=2681412 RepID=UPI001F265B53|nr:sugar transferase [Roseomonas sp. 18066]